MKYVLNIQTETNERSGKDPYEEEKLSSFGTVDCGKEE
jgi:hypothetical protein